MFRFVELRLLASFLADHHACSSLDSLPLYYPPHVAYYSSLRPFRYQSHLALEVTFAHNCFASLSLYSAHKHSLCFFANHHDCSSLHFPPHFAFTLPFDHFALLRSSCLLQFFLINTTQYTTHRTLLFIAPLTNNRFSRSHSLTWFETVFFD